MTAQGDPGGDVISVEGSHLRYRTRNVPRDVAFQARVQTRVTRRREPALHGG